MITVTNTIIKLFHIQPKLEDLVPQKKMVTVHLSIIWSNYAFNSRSRTESCMSIMHHGDNNLRNLVDAAFGRHIQGNGKGHGIDEENPLPTTPYKPHVGGDKWATLFLSDVETHLPIVVAWIWTLSSTPATLDLFACFAAIEPALFVLIKSYTKEYLSFVRQIITE